MAVNQRHFISSFDFGFRFHEKFTAAHAGMYIPPNTEYVFECTESWPREMHLSNHH